MSVAKMKIDIAIVLSEIIDRVPENPVEFYQGKYEALQFDWKSHRKEGRFPEPAALKETLEDAGYEWSEIKVFFDSVIWAIVYGKAEALLNAAFGGSEAVWHNQH